MLRVSRRKGRVNTLQAPPIAVISFLLSLFLIMAPTHVSAQSEFRQFLDTAYRRHTNFEGSLDALHEFDRNGLSPEDQLSYDLFEWYLEDQAFYRPILLGDLHPSEVPYDQLLMHHTTTTLSAEVLFDILSAEVTANRHAVNDLLESLEIDGDSMIERMAVVGELGIQKTVNGNVSVVDEMQGYVDTAEKALREHFACFPADPIVVAYVPGLSSLAGLRMGSKAQGRPNQVQILPGRDGVPYYLRMTIAHHEAFPGHYVQEHNQQLLAHLPEFRLKGGFRAYGEAWALYGEQLAWDVGLYESVDPLHKLGFVESRLWRSSLAMMDVAVNGLGCSSDDAQTFLLETLGIDEAGARDRINRMIEDPGAATSSYTGYLCYLAFRERMHVALGDAFRLIDFHSLVLETGPAPMEILEQIIDEYIEMSVRN